MRVQHQTRQNENDTNWGGLDPEIERPALIEKTVSIDRVDQVPSRARGNELRLDVVGTLRESRCNIIVGLGKPATWRNLLVDPAVGQT